MRTNSLLSRKPGANGIVQNVKPKPVLLSRNGLPVLPVKKMSPEMLAEIKEREEQANRKPVVVNLAEERLKLKEENDRRI